MPNRKSYILDIAEALEPFEFTGTYYSAETRSEYPNPCLRIDGVGEIGLPISQRDVDAILAISAGSDNVDGCDTAGGGVKRQIDSSSLVFSNKRWHTFLDEVAHKTIDTKLAAEIPYHRGAKFKLELKNLCIFETGTSLASTNREKSNRAFATFVITLPSAFRGGSINLAYGPLSQSISFAEGSDTCLSVLSWFNGPEITFRAQPVQCGHLFALSYDVVYDAAPGDPPQYCPGISCLDESLSNLRRALANWKDLTNSPRKEVSVDCPNLFAIWLSDLDEDDPSAHEAGLSAIDGDGSSDINLLTYLQFVATELGLAVGLALLHQDSSFFGMRDGEYIETDSDDDLYSSRYGYDNEYRPRMTKGELNKKKVFICDPVDLKGVPILRFGGGKIAVQEGQVYPDDPFDDDEPYETDNDEFSPDGRRLIIEHFRHHVVIIFDPAHEDSICFGAKGGPSQAIRLLRQAAIPLGARERAWANRLVSNLGKYETKHARELVELSMRWGDVEMWKAVMKNTGCGPILYEFKTEDFVKASKCFTFLAIQNSLSEIASRSYNLQHRLEFVYSFPELEEQDVMETWKARTVGTLLSAYDKPRFNDVTLILCLILIQGVGPIINSLLPKLDRTPGTYDFCLALMKALTAHQQRLLAGEMPANVAHPSQVLAKFPTTAPTVFDLARVVNLSLQIAARQWEDPPMDQDDYYDAYPRYHIHRNENISKDELKVHRVVEIIELSLENNLDFICVWILDNVLNSYGDPAKKFTLLYFPILRSLASLAKKPASARLYLSRPLFAGFSKEVVLSYLHHNLGAEHEVHSQKLRALGCGSCRDCTELDKFLLNPKTDVHVFRVNQGRRTHLERQLSKASDLCRYHTVQSGLPYSLQVQKHEDIVAEATWQSRTRRGQEVLRIVSCGNEETLRNILGSYYDDVRKVLPL